ncbi:MFS transporter [Sinanaerobacter chloroacetimidivorans]|uniref:MFS transporter n=1 Tax=Sinanaerobacter chloroacetimidivorans TaxID=2818044 RepID=A0A8J7W0D7_9FIRM|nr:MFS transporter [Sinanaerobacter chloroacetimidivorans]MBR0598497.1 MFS transporter [Sinanaerobacter chloroacetimidivorans]
MNTAKIQYSKIGIISIAHMLNDLYSNYLPQMLPFLVVLYQGFTATRAAIVVSAFSITSSFTQPLFGYFMDRQGKRWLAYIGTLWMATMLSLTGLVQNYFLLVVLAALAGLGTAVFHPQASAMVNRLSMDRKAVILSVFVAFGNFGFALGPLLLVPLFQTFGLSATVVTIIPGIIVALLLFLFSPQDQTSANVPPTLGVVFKTLRASAKELTAIVGVIAVRSLAYTGLLTILPLYFKYKSLSNIQASHLVTIMLAAGAIGGVIGGFISDYFGRKQLIIGSLILSTPLFFAFLLTNGILSTVFLALAGAALLSSFSVTVVAAQEAIPDNKALAAGITMGFAGGLGSLAVVIIGRIGDVFGLPAAVAVLFGLPIIAGFLGFFMKNRQPARLQRQTG